MPIIAKERMYRLSTNETVACPICGFTTYGGDEVAFSDVSNHILQEHKLKCLHVGQESRLSDSGGLAHSTVAVFGK
jgi:hypothetical protein